MTLMPSPAPPSPNTAARSGGIDQRQKANTVPWRDRLPNKPGYHTVYALNPARADRFQASFWIT
ncbi:MAG: hypothetical protein AAF225_07295 [Pseudomonadota bacterium]